MYMYMKVSEHIECEYCVHVHACMYMYMYM